MTEQLRPCPFCNKNPEVAEAHDIRLIVCKCIAGCVKPGLWNLRPIEDKLLAEIQDLKNANAVLTKALEVRNG